MGIYTLGFETTAPAAGAPFFALGTELELPLMSVLSISVILNTATVSKIGLIYSDTKGTADPTMVSTGINEGEGDSTASSQGQVATGWTVAPTIAAPPKFLRKIRLPAVEGAAFEWDWDPMAPLTFGGSLLNTVPILLLWNYGAAAASDLTVTIRWAENRIVSGYRQNYAVQKTVF